MNKTAMLIAPLLLLTPIMFIDFTLEEDEAVVTEVKDALLYEVYKVDLWSVSNVSVYSDTVVSVVYFDVNDTENKEKFEEALRNREPLSLQGILDITWDYTTTYNVTAYIFGFPVYSQYNYSDTYLYITTKKDGITEYGGRYILDEHRLDLSSGMYIIGGQDVKITIDDSPSGVSLILASSYDNQIDLNPGENQVTIEQGADYRVFANDWIPIPSEPYVSYTIEYMGLPSETHVYGQVFLIVGALFMVVMLWFARPQKIRK